MPRRIHDHGEWEHELDESEYEKWRLPTGGGMKKMLGRLVSGDSMFQNRFTAEGSDGTIAFASSFPGAIKALNISAGHSMIVQKSAFLASEDGVELSMHFQKSWVLVSLAAKASSCRS